MNDSIPIYRVNIFDSGMQTLVCPVNVVGVMGKGLALQFRHQVPGLYKAYQKACIRGELGINKLWVYEHPDVPYRVLCFPTKGHWKYPSKKSDIEKNLKLLADTYKELKITSLAIPPIGCGEGGLNWYDIHDVVQELLADVEMEVRIVIPT